MSRIKLIVFVLLLTPPVVRGSMAEDLAIPARVQADLVTKLASYDRNLPERAREKVRVAILWKPNDVDSARAANQIRDELGAKDSIAGLPREEVMVPWENAGRLVQVCVERKISVLYIAPGLTKEIAEVAAALVGKSLLTVASVPNYVERGVVLGFELVSGRPKLMINLAQAQRQDVAFRAEVLKLMRVVQ